MGLGSFNSFAEAGGAVVLAPCRPLLHHERLAIGEDDAEAQAWWRQCNSTWEPTSTSSYRRGRYSSFNGQVYGQGYGGQPDGQLYGQGGADDYDADADDDPAAEEARAEKEEVLNETRGKAKQVLDVLKRVDAETDSSKAQLVEIGAKAIDFKARFRFRNAALAASTAHEITAHPGEVNGLLEKLSKDSQQLEELMTLSKVGQPFRLRSHLIRLAGDAERASQLMDVKIDKLKEALRIMKHAGGEYVDLGEGGEGDEGVEGEGGEGAAESTPVLPVQENAANVEMTAQGGQEQLGMTGGLQPGVPSGMPYGPSPDQVAQGAQEMAMEEKMESAQAAAMSGVTASEDAEATAEEMESEVQNKTWSIDELPQPLSSDVEPQEPAPAGEPPLPVVETSSGCTCDPTAKCALQGQPFTWCRVGTSEEPSCGELEAASDPTGRDHALGVQGRMWDYCVPHQMEQPDTQEGVEELTSHLGCECAPRMDVLQKYMNDPLFHNMETGEIDIQKVPFKDRITIEAMQKYLQDGGDLCQQTPSSGQFLACPAAKDCAGSNVAGPGGALPSGWFSGVSGKSWDFCAPVPEPPAEPPTEQAPQDMNGHYGANGVYNQNYGAYGMNGMNMQYQMVPEGLSFIFQFPSYPSFSSKRSWRKDFL